MSRRRRPEKREILPDPKFGDQVLSKFMNNLMLDGKKSLSESILYEALDIAEEKSGQPGINVFQQALNNAKPQLEVKSRRVGGATYQVPIEVRPERRQALAIKWLISFSRARTSRCSCFITLSSAQKTPGMIRMFLRFSLLSFSSTFFKLRALESSFTDASARGTWSSAWGTSRSGAWTTRPGAYAKVAITRKG